MYKTIASFNGDVKIYDGKLGYANLFKLTAEMPKNIEHIEVLHNDSDFGGFIVCSYEDPQCGVLMVLLWNTTTSTSTTPTTTTTTTGNTIITRNSTSPTIIMFYLNNHRLIDRYYQISW